MGKRVGTYTVQFDRPVLIRGRGSAVGQEEGKGPLGGYFDQIAQDAMWGQDSFEKAEKRFFMEAAKKAVESAGLGLKDIHYLLGGDLLNQIFSESYSARDLDIPFLGLYGACSSMAESLCIGSMLIDGGFAQNILCATSSHFATAERQFRYPLELGTPKPPTGQDTVTGAGATVISAEQGDLEVKSVTVGRVVDFGIKDANNMGAAMAPAAVQTILSNLEDLNADPSYYDAIITGDLGIFGSDILLDLAGRNNVDLSGVHKDCGKMIFEGMDKNCGASGCGCGASVLNAYFFKKMLDGDLQRILFVATGALLSPTSVQQGESIPSIAHAVHIERRAGK